jgi:outer membrane protein assembly factor BamB
VASSAPVVRAGSDVVVASPGHSVVLDAETGARRRQIGGIDDTGVGVDDGRIVITGAYNPNPDTHISAFDRATGSVIWTQTAEFALTAPVIANGIAYVDMRGTVGTHDGVLWAYRLSDGKKLWHTGSCCSFVAPAVADGVLYFLVETRGSPTMLHAYDAVTGAPRWSVPAPECFPATAPVISGGKVYVSGSTYDAATGAHLWSWPVCAGTTVVTVSPSTLYVPYRPTPTTAALEAIDASTGAVRWSIPWGVNAFGYPSTPAVANGLLFAADGSTLIAADADSGARLWRSKAATGTYGEPIVSNGWVYAMNTEGKVRAFSLP